MIFQVLSNEEIVQVKDELESDLPGSAKMFYILSNFLSGLLRGFEVLVDHWPQWTCIILRPQSPDSVASYFQHYYICHTRSVKAFRFFLQRPCVVDWTKPICFTGVPHDAAPTLQEQCRKHGGRLSSIENRYMYVWMKKDPPQMPPVPEGLTLTTLKPSHAATLCQRWKHYRPDPALDHYMRAVTLAFDSSAIVDGEGQLLAYVGMQFNGAMAMLHVDPQQRGRGLGQVVLADLTRKLTAQGKMAFGFIPTKDTSFLATSSHKLGFTWVPQGSFAWVRYVPKASASPPYPVGTLMNQAPVVPPSSLITPGKEQCREEEGGGLFLTALPLSCNECADISNDVSGACVHIGMGVS